MVSQLYLQHGWFHVYCRRTHQWGEKFVSLDFHKPINWQRLWWDFFECQQILWFIRICYTWYATYIGYVSFIRSVTYHILHILFYNGHPNLKYQFHQGQDPKDQSMPRHKQLSFHHNIGHTLGTYDAKIRILSYWKCNRLVDFSPRPRNSWSRKITNSECFSLYY